MHFQEKKTKMPKTREHQLKTEQVCREKHSFTCRRTEAVFNTARKSDLFLKSDFEVVLFALFSHTSETYHYQSVN